MKHIKPIEFDLTKFVDVNHGFVTPPRPISKYPKSLLSIKECVKSAIYMASQIDLVEYGISTTRPESSRPAYFRASLTELCRIEDVVKASGLPFSFYGSNDPSLHILKLLRNYQVHIAASELSGGQVTVQCSGENMVYRSFIAENVTALELQKLNSAKPYSEDQLVELVKLFDLQQRKLGVVQFLYHLIKRVEEYSIHNLAK